MQRDFTAKVTVHLKSIGPLTGEKLNGYSKKRAMKTPNSISYALMKVITPIMTLWKIKIHVVDSVESLELYSTTI